MHLLCTIITAELFALMSALCDAHVIACQRVHTDRLIIVHQLQCPIWYSGEGPNVNNCKFLYGV